MYIGLIGYMIGITFGTNDPQNIVVKVTSFIPLISSYIMPVRLATETASTMEAIVSLVILAVFGIILTIFCSFIQIKRSCIQRRRHDSILKTVNFFLILKDPVNQSK